MHARADAYARAACEGYAGLIVQSRTLDEMASLKWLTAYALRSVPDNCKFGSGLNRIPIASSRTDDTCTHIPASCQHGWVYTHTACSTWPCRSLWPSSLFCRELRPRVADLSWQLTDLARSGLAVAQACHRAWARAVAVVPGRSPYAVGSLPSISPCLCAWRKKACVDC